MSYTPKIIKREQRVKSTGEKFVSEVMYLAVGLFMVWIICGIIKIIFLPFQYLFMSAKAKRERYIERSKNKVVRRKEYRDTVRENINNPLMQYLARYETSPESFKDDPEGNLAHLMWYMDWKEGKVLDSRLSWAPDLYLSLGVMNPSFLSYLKCQIELHKESGFFRRFRFMETIRSYYPEFAPKFKRFIKDVDSYSDISEEIKLKGVLREEIMKIGVSLSIAKKLEKMDLSAEEIVETASKIKTAIENGFTSELAYCFAENDIDSKSEEAQFIKDVCSDFKSTLLSPKIAVARAKHLISDDQLINFMMSTKSLVEIMGSDTFGVDEHSKCGDSFYDQHVDTKLAEYMKDNRHNLIEGKLGKAKWEV